MQPVDPVLKTRDKLIEVARQLFARNGIENTTMNDIAVACDKGRRTIYTYFKTKRDIYDAVIERESELIVKRLTHAVNSTDNPEERLHNYLTIRIEGVDKIVPTHPDNIVWSFFNGELKKVERIRKLVAAKEQELMQQILNDGIAAGVFDPSQAERLHSILFITIQALAATKLRNAPDEPLNASASAEIVDFIVDGIKSKNQQSSNNSSNKTPIQL